MDYSKILGDDFFTFIAGTSKKIFKVHTNAVARISKPLSALMNGKWKESEQKTAELPDVEEQVFVDFLEFAYTGKYRAEVLESIHKTHKTRRVDYVLPHAPLDYDFIFLNRAWLLHGNFFCTFCGNELSRWSTNTSVFGCSPNCQHIISKLDADGEPPSEANNSLSTNGRFCISCGDDGCRDFRSHCDVMTAASLLKADVDGFMRFSCRRCINTAIHMGDRCNESGDAIDSIPNIATLLVQILHHCKMYVLGDRFCITSLQFWSFSFVWMHLSLVRFQMQEDYDGKHTPDFAEILRYISGNSKRGEAKDILTFNNDKLCQLIVDFNVDQRHLRARYLELVDSLGEDHAGTKEMLLAAMKGYKTTRPWYLPEDYN